jgi:hypothetical protein
MRVWNITDDPSRKDIAATPLVIFDKLVNPGAYADVPEMALENATKIHKEEAAGLLFIGPKLPEAYLQAKSPARAVIKDSVKRAHGEGVKSLKVTVTNDGLKVKEEENKYSSYSGSKKNRR